VIRPFECHEPSFPATVFVASGAHVIGQVSLGADSSVWFNVVLRGDINSITIGERTNIQDGTIMHVTGAHPVVVGSDVTIGHRAIVHGCTIGNSCLIGMGSIVLDGARVGDHSLVAAGAVVLQDFAVPEGSLVAGVPGKIIRQLTDDERSHIMKSARNYVEYARRFQTT